MCVPSEDSRPWQWEESITSHSEPSQLRVKTLDVRETYIDFIFYPGRFSSDAILRALNVSLMLYYEH